MRTQTEKFTFVGSQGTELDARLDRPSHDPRGYALFAHCFTCSKDLIAASTISSVLVEAGIGVLRFDFTGLGSSDGDFANTNFSSNITDLTAAADALRERHRGPEILIGHSLGGAAVLAAAGAGHIPEVRAVATIGAPADPAHAKCLLTAADIDAIAETGEAEVNLGGRSFTVRKQFLDDISGQNLEASIGSLDAGLLVLHSPDDETVSIDHAQRIFAAANHPKSLVAIDGAGHLLSDRSDARYVASLLATWVGRYLTGSVAPTDPGKTPEGLVIVEETHEGKFTQLVSAGNHHFRADEPVGIGDDTGPSPYDLLLAGLGACTSTTLRMYAGRKAMPLDHVRVALTHDRVHSEDCADVDGKPCRLTHIGRTIEVDGDLTDDQRASLSRIADRCPVHLTLEGKIHVETTLR